MLQLDRCVAEDGSLRAEGERCKCDCDRCWCGRNGRIAYTKMACES